MGGKIQNSRQLLLRAARDSSGSDEEALSVAASRMGGVLERLRDSRDLDQVRGAEGEAARGYFEVFGHMVRGDRATWCVVIGPHSRRLAGPVGHLGTR